MASAAAWPPRTAAKCWHAVAPKGEKSFPYDPMVLWITAHSDYTKFRNPDLYLRTASFYVPVLLGEGAAQVGITISRKVGKAVQRNLLKRRIKSWVRSQAISLPSGCKINLIARPVASQLSWDDLCHELEQVATMLRTRCQ